MNGTTAEIKRMFALPKYRRKGIGRLLLDVLVNEAKKAGYCRIRLDTASYMKAAHKLYSAKGFRKIDPYQGTETAKEYWKYWTFMELEL